MKAPTKNWKRILLTRAGWPKNFRWQGVPQMPHKHTWATDLNDESLRWCWYLYRMPGGSDYFLGIWPSESREIGEAAPEWGYIRFSAIEAFKFIQLQHYHQPLYRDYLKAKQGRSKSE